jgi:hypothetical protein
MCEFWFGIDAQCKLAVVCFFGFFYVRGVRTYLAVLTTVLRH